MTKADGVLGWKFPGPETVGGTNGVFRNLRYSSVELLIKPYGNEPRPPAAR